jgi:hypothetical protein
VCHRCAKGRIGIPVISPRTGCKSGSGRCWARTSDLRLVETARRDSQMPSWVKESTSMQGVCAVRFGIRWPCRTVGSDPVGRNGDAAGPGPIEQSQLTLPVANPRRARPRRARRRQFAHAEGAMSALDKPLSWSRALRTPRLTRSSGRERAREGSPDCAATPRGPPRRRVARRSWPSSRPLARAPDMRQAAALSGRRAGAAHR